MSKHILILRPDNLGDALLFSGALKHLRRRFDGYSITLCAKSYARNYFELCPHIDSFLAWEDLLSAINGAPEVTWYPDGVPGKGRFRLALGRFRRARFVRRMGFDEILIPVRSPQSGWTEVLATFPYSRKTGLSGDLSNHRDLAEHRAYVSVLDVVVDVSDFEKDRHEFQATLRLLHKLGLKVGLDDIWPEYWTSADDTQAIMAMVGKYDYPLVVLAPGKVSNADGRLDPSFYAAALRGGVSGKITVALIGTSEEEPYCAEVARALKEVPCVDQIIYLPGKTTVRQTVELLKLARAVVSLETATAHMAVMLRVPTVGIIGGGHFGRFFPWGDRAVVKEAYQQMDCFGCNWNCIHSSLRCITEIDPLTVSGHLSSLLAQQ